MVPHPLPDPLRLVLFDLDGTLLDTLDDIALALGRALEREGFVPRSREEVASMVGEGARILVARASGLGPDDVRVDRLMQRYVEEYARDPTPATRPMPGAIALLDALVAAGIPAIVCTNKPRIITVPVVERMLGARIRGIVAAGDVPRLKPDRAPIDAALALGGASAPQCAMVGDAPPDVLSARAAGVFAVAVRGGFSDPRQLADAGPDLMVDGLDELVRAFRL